MVKESFRFIHASDFHLERPMQDIMDLPDHLRRTLVEAPWKAAASVFEHALLENVDFVVLSGDLLNPVAAGAQGVAFLLDRFEELAAREIEVYWAGGGADDPERWPESVALPSNVHVFSKRGVEPVIHRRNGIPLVTLLGRSSDGAETIRAAEYAHEADDNYAIAVAMAKQILKPWEANELTTGRSVVSISLKHCRLNNHAFVTAVPHKQDRSKKLARMDLCWSISMHNAICKFIRSKRT